MFVFTDYCPLFTVHMAMSLSCTSNRSNAAMTSRGDVARRSTMFARVHKFRLWRLWSKGSADGAAVGWFGALSTVGLDDLSLVAAPSISLVLSTVAGLAGKGE